MSIIKNMKLNQENRDKNRADFRHDLLLFMGNTIERRLPLVFFRNI